MEKFNIRLKQAMALRGISQTELCELTDIPKSAMSQYLSGNFKPKQTRTYILSEALHVSPAWLMGYNVPQDWIEEKDSKTTTSTDAELTSLVGTLVKTNDECTKKFIIKFLKLPPQNREVFIKMLSSITES